MIHSKYGTALEQTSKPIDSRLLSSETTGDQIHVIDVEIGQAAVMWSEALNHLQRIRITQVHHTIGRTRGDEVPCTVFQYDTISFV